MINVQDIARGLAGLFVCFGVAACTSKPSSTVETEVSMRPNIVLVITDDQGYGDFGFTGNTHLETPVLDQLSRDGLFFDRFYVSAVCAPTRASLLTGRDALRTGVFHVTRNGEALASDEYTMAEVFKDNGYQTGAFGKWHNGAHFPEHPMGQGFETFFGFASGHITRYFNSVMEKNGQPVETTGYIADVITDEAIKFIDENRNEPFFAYLALNTPHSPFELPDDKFEKYKAKGLSDLDASVYGMVENIDDNMGRLLDALDTHKISENTIVIFISDNGPAFPGKNERYNAGLKGYKGSLNEGGVRVPLLVKWPEGLEGGKKVSALTQHIDLLPTLASLTGIDFTAINPIDGIDQSSVWKGNVEQIDDERFIFGNRTRNTKKGYTVGVQRYPGSVRNQKWAAISERNGSWALFDIEEDPSQNNDLADVHPDRLETMVAVYNEWFDAASSEAESAYLPITIGTDFSGISYLPAHEAHLQSDDVEYANGAGWSHDWITGWGKSGSSIEWPIKIASKGNYELTIHYRATGASTVSAEIQGRVAKKTLGSAEATLLPGNRLYWTGEAEEFDWEEAVVGDFKLETGETKLKIALQENVKGLEVKAVTIRRKE